jgi:hypothetical protein
MGKDAVNTNAISLDERFTAFELAQMFNVDCDPNCSKRNTLRVRYIEANYAFNDVRVPLLVNRKRKVSKRVKHYCDEIKSGITTHEPGTKGRVADLAKWYAANAANEESAFEV